MHLLTVEVVAFCLAVVVAIRSTWSPCGISMLSTLTPLGERSRGHRYPVTVGWFVAGAATGGALLGAVMAGAASLVRLWSPSDRAVAVVVVMAAAVTIASDLKLGGFQLPTVPRQVNEVWTGRYRRWVYAAAFGAQVGVGVVTYVMTAGLYLVIVLAAMTARPVEALVVGLTFGLVRGVAVLLGVGLTTPQAIRQFHRRFEALGAWSLAIAVSAQFAVLLAAVGGAPAALLVVLGAAAYGFTELRRVRRRRISRAIT